MARREQFAADVLSSLRCLLTARDDQAKAHLSAHLDRLDERLERHLGQADPPTVECRPAIAVGAAAARKVER